MALAPDGGSLSKFTKVKRYNNAIKYIENEFKEFCITDWTVDFLEFEKNGPEPDSVLSIKFTDDRETDQVMEIHGSLINKLFNIIVSINEGDSLPYHMEIQLNGPTHDNKHATTVHIYQML